MTSSYVRTVPQTSRQEFAALVSAVPALTFASKSDGACIYFNERWESLLGRPVADLLGLGWSEWIHPDDREQVVTLWTEAVDKQESFASLHRFVSTSGPVWVTVEAQPVWTEGKHFVGHSGCAQKLPSQLLDTSTLAARGLAHDLNNVLTLVVGALDIESKEGRIDDDDSRIILEALARASELTGELLGKKEAQVPTVLNEFIERFVTVMEPALPPGIRIRLALDTSLDPVAIYPSALWRALANLVFNARDALTNGGEIAIETKQIGDATGAMFTRITVRDTGIGVPAASLERIFEPGVSTKGGGLGLAVVQACARLHGGQVCAESRAGKGAAFHIKLPRKG